MVKRSIADDEIALIKAMLRRGMKNRDIQFYFNRPDRPVNTGRITGIRKGTYGPKITPATEAILATFLNEQNSRRSSGSSETKRSVGDKAKEHFEKRGSLWVFKSRETDAAECKKNFLGIKPAERAAAAIKAIAGLANNNGGFIFFGVEELPNKTLCVTGLHDEAAFAKLDPAEFNQLLASTLDPVPVFQLGIAEIGGKLVGFIEVASHDGAPIIALRNLGGDIREGGIYFRYVGETRLIKPGELRQLLASRERRAVEEFARAMSKVANGAATTLDLDSGEIAGKNATFLLDQDSLQKIQFLREGEFKEREGAPAVRLIGDARALRPGEDTRIVRQNVTPDSILNNFLRGELVSEPLQYILTLAHSNREWLPLWYYARLSKLSIDQIVNSLNSERPSQPSHRDLAIQRLLGQRSAYKMHPGTPRRLLNGFLAGKISEPKTIEDDSAFALAVQGLPNGQRELERFRNYLASAADRAQSTDTRTNSRRSNIFRAACRLDELLYAPTQSLK